MKRPWTAYFLAGALGVLSLCLVGTLAVGSSTISPSIFDHAKPVSYTHLTLPTKA